MARDGAGAGDVNYGATVALVVDDDPITRGVVREYVLQLGCRQVLEAGDGVIAQEILSERADIDIVLTDIVMPRLDGLGLVAWARQARPGPVWVILSALDRFDKAVEAIRLGAFDFLAKPVREQELGVAVHNALQHLSLLRERARLYDELQQQVLDLESKSELLRRDLARAEIIQRALLPNAPPDLPIRAQAVYRPGHYVGGDLYDVQRLDQRHIAFYVADATGHGVTAAMLSVLFKQQVSTMTPEVLRSPRQVLEQANQTLTVSLNAPGLFLTVFYGVIDLEQQLLTAASAGHPPALYKKIEGESQLLARTGPALGLSASARYTEHRQKLTEGDMLLVYTDGLLDAEGLGTGQNLWELIERGDSTSDLFANLLVKTSRARARHADEIDDVTALLIVNKAGDSRFDNGAVGEKRSAKPALDKQPPVIFCGESANTWFLALRGRAIWKHSEVFFDTANAILEEQHALVLDLADCEYLDSTMLGTVHELIARGPVRLQNVPDQIRVLFEELSMTSVLEKISPARTPPEMVALTAEGGAAAHVRILQAHKALAAISESNQTKFKDVLDAIL